VIKKIKENNTKIYRKQKQKKVENLKILRPTGFLNIKADKKAGWGSEGLISQKAIKAYRNWEVVRSKFMSL